MSNEPCRYLASAASGSVMTSTWILLRVGFGRPHQFGIAAKSSDWLAARADILKAPVPTRVSGLLHQPSKLVLTTCRSTIMPAAEGCAIADSNHPAALVSLTTTVESSGAVRPDMVTAGSLFSSSASSAAPAV